MRKKYNRVGYAVLTMCTALSISLPLLLIQHQQKALLTLHQKLKLLL